MPARSESDTAIASAVADVVVAARNVAVDQVDLVRLRARDDLRHMMAVAVYGAAAVTLLGIALTSGAVAIAWTLTLWLPLAAACGIVAAATLAGGGVLLAKARHQFPQRVPNEPPRALPAATVKEVRG